jgi:hypothetical protein
MRGAGHEDLLVVLQVPGNKAGAVPCERLQQSYFRRNRMSFINFTKFALALIFGVLITSCAGTKLTDTYIDKNYSGEPVSNILVIGVTYEEKDEVRRSFEDRFAAQLKAAGVEAIASGDAVSIPSDLMLKKEDIIGVVEKLNNDAVIVTHVAGIEDESSYTRLARSPRTYFDYYGHVYGNAHSYGYRSTKTFYRLKTNLYDVKTEKLIWSGQSETLNPDSPVQMIDDVINVLIKDLQKNNLIKRSNTP